MRKSTLLVGGGIVAALIVGTAGGAHASAWITGSSIKNGTVTGADIKDGSLGTVDLSAKARAALHGAKGATGATGAKGATGATGAKGATGATGAQGLPGKDGVTDLNAGAGYTHTWVGDNGDHLNTIVAKCDAGQVALSGGFSTWGGSDVNEAGLPYDLGGDNKSIQITVSAPYTGQAYDEAKYHGGILPDRWVVKGYNNGSTDQIVRAWVVCADAS